MNCRIRVLTISVIFCFVFFPTFFFCLCRFLWSRRRRHRFEQVLEPTPMSSTFKLEMHTNTEVWEVGLSVCLSIVVRQVRFWFFCFPSGRISFFVCSCCAF